jgi:OsmC subfamily peroxiredoxin
VTASESLIDAQLQQIADRLRTIRFARGLRLHDIAAMTGLSEVHLYRLEQGERAPSLRALLTLAAALDLEPAELLTPDLAPRGVPHTGRAIWNGTEKSGSGVMIKGGVRVQYDLARRANPPADTDQDATGGSPEALLGMAFAGCFSMALAADLDDAGYEPQRIETFTQVRAEAGAGGVSITGIDLSCEAAVPRIIDEQFQKLAENTKRTCLLARATAAIPARLDARLVPLDDSSARSAP